MSTTLDETRIEAFAGQIVDDVGAALGTALVTIGDRLGFYRAMADAQPVSAAELAARTGTHERYVREWLNAQAAGGYVTYIADSDRYVLPAEHAFVLADEESSVALAGMVQAAAAAFGGREHVVERFRSGDGLGWHEHHHDLFHGTGRAFGAKYRAQLVSEWLPALDGVVDRLTAGGRVADIGCGHGVSTILMAEAFPASTFVGFDYHVASIEAAREGAAAAGVDDRVGFEIARADDYPGDGYDLVAFFDSLHDLGDPVGAAARACRALGPDGVCLVVEPYAGDTIEQNLTPLGRAYYGFSALVCTPGSLSQDGRAGLGTQAGARRLTEVLKAGGFTRVRLATETPFNLVLEARP
jgi:SAM-dependent methyltransferase